MSSAPRIPSLRHPHQSQVVVLNGNGHLARGMLERMGVPQLSLTMSDPYPNSMPSACFQQLDALFHSLNRPYDAADLIRFNLVFHRVYPDLNPDEKRHTDDLVEALAADLDEMDRVCRLGED